MRVMVRVEVGEETFNVSYYCPSVVTENFDIARRAFPDEGNLAQVWVYLATIGMAETVKTYGAMVARDVKAQLKEVMRG